MQVLEPGTGEYVPAAHDVHTVIEVPRVPEKLVPAGHGVHVENPRPSAYVPAGHD